MIMLCDYHSAFFLKSADTIFSLLKDSMNIELVFVGYSNSGKSSIINKLTNQKQLTVISKIPGCTQCINIFKLSCNVHMVEFPGYGYSKKIAKQKQKNYWHEQICQFLKIKKYLKGLILVMDIRYPMKILDYSIIKYACVFDIPIIILLNKSDKISNYREKIILKEVNNKIYTVFAKQIPIEIFSAIENTKVDFLKKIFNKWLKL